MQRCFLTTLTFSIQFYVVYPRELTLIAAQNENSLLSVTLLCD